MRVGDRGLNQLGPTRFVLGAYSRKIKKPTNKLALLHALILLDMSRRTHVPKPTLPKIVMPFAPDDEWGQA